MKLLVTGAGGQLGAAVVERAGGDFDVVGLTSSELDITDVGAVDAALARQRPDAVLNCAAYTAVDAAETDEARATAVNADGPAALARACAREGAWLVHVSTDYVFAGDAARAYEPADPTRPKTAYGRSKLAGERAVRAAAPTATIVRTAWLYRGLEPGTSSGDFVTTMRRLERERDTVNVVDDQRGSPTYALDLADGLLALLASGGPTGAVLHATNAGETTWFELARAVFAGVGADPLRVRPCTSAEFPRPAARPAYSVLSGRAWSDAGLPPLRPWQQALEDALRAAPPAGGGV